MTRAELELWLLDKLAYRADVLGHLVSWPFFRVSQWAGARWWERVDAIGGLQHLSEEHEPSKVVPLWSRR